MTEQHRLILRRAAFLLVRGAASLAVITLVLSIEALEALARALEAAQDVTPLLPPAKPLDEAPEALSEDTKPTAKRKGVKL